MNDILLTPIRLNELEALIENSIRKVLNSQQANPATAGDEWFNLSQLCEYLSDHPKKSTIYGYVSAGIIPVHKSTKKLRFLKSEIDEWLKSGRRKTDSEIKAEAPSYLRKRKQ
jgi:predicted DNA-binding transcriptional regulator AlpA